MQVRGETGGIPESLPGARPGWVTDRDCTELTEVDPTRTRPEHVAPNESSMTEPWSILLATTTRVSMAEELAHRWISLKKTPARRISRRWLWNRARAKKSLTRRRITYLSLISIRSLPMRQQSERTRRRNFSAPDGKAVGGKMFYRCHAFAS